MKKIGLYEKKTELFRVSPKLEAGVFILDEGMDLEDAVLFPFEVEDFGTYVKNNFSEEFLKLIRRTEKVELYQGERTFYSPKESTSVTYKGLDNLPQLAHAVKLENIFNPPKRHNPEIIADNKAVLPRSD
ncbi:hypothetical protein HY837_04420 [archaeon]|nr:hypothetical protein [archaeon]